MTKNRIGGTIFLKVDGVQYDAKGNFTYNIGTPMREAVVGADTVHGFKETPQVPYLEGEITDNIDLDLRQLQLTDEATLTLELANGKVLMYENAWFAGEGTGQTEEGNISVRFEAKSAQEII